MSRCVEDGTLVCLDCVCLTWSSMVGLVLPLLISLIYLPRIAREATIDHWLILVFATVFTYASKTPSDAGVAHTPMMVFIICLWAIAASLTDRVDELKSLPMVWVFGFVSVLIPDLISTSQHRPEGAIGIPGGRGLIDGLIVKPMMGLAAMTLVYIGKVYQPWPNQERRGKVYDKTARDFLLNISPGYRRPSHLRSRLGLAPAMSLEMMKPPSAV